MTPWAREPPTLDRATYGNVSMTRLVSSPVCPAIWPFIIRAAVTVGIPIPRSTREHSRASHNSHSQSSDEPIWLCLRAASQMILQNKSFRWVTNVSALNQSELRNFEVRSLSSSRRIVYHQNSASRCFQVKWVGWVIEADNSWAAIKAPIYAGSRACVAVSQSLYCLI